MKWSSFKYLVRQGIHSLGTHSMMTFASIGVLTVCLVLTGIAYLFSVNVDSLIDYLGSQNETVVYLNPDLDEEQTAAVDTAIRSISGVSGVEYVSKEDVLSTYKGYMSEQYADLWDAFDNDNPFKANYRVTVKDLDDIQRISDELSAIEGVDSVSAPLAMSNVFVQGMAAGLISAFIASVIVLGGYWVLTYYSDLVPGFWRSLLSESVVPVTDVWYKVVPAFAAFSVLMGGVGSLVSIRKHLDV